MVNNGNKSKTFKKPIVSINMKLSDKTVLNEIERWTGHKRPTSKITVCVLSTSFILSIIAVFISCVYMLYVEGWCSLQ